jgi:hypothetical protein
VAATNKHIVLCHKTSDHKQGMVPVQKGVARSVARSSVITNYKCTERFFLLLKINFHGDDGLQTCQMNKDWTVIYCCCFFAMKRENESSYVYHHLYTPTNF